MIIIAPAVAAVGKYGATATTASATATVVAIIAGAEPVAVLTGTLTVAIGAAVKFLGDRPALAYSALEKQLERTEADLMWHRGEVARLHERIDVLEQLADDARVAEVKQRIRTHEAILWGQHAAAICKRHGLDPPPAPDWTDNP